MNQAQHSEDGKHRSLGMTPALLHVHPVLEPLIPTKALILELRHPKRPSTRGRLADIYRLRQTDPENQIRAAISSSGNNKTAFMLTREILQELCYLQM